MKRWIVLTCLIASGGVMMALASLLEPPAIGQAHASTPPVSAPGPVTAPPTPTPASTTTPATTAATAPAASPAPSIPPRVADIKKIRDSLYVITGGGINTLAFVTAKGVVLVDPKADGWGPAIMDKLKTVTPKPVTTVINTDAGADHTGDNAFFAKTAEIISQENTRTNMEKAVAARGDRAATLPKRTYADKMSLFDGKDRIELRYFGPGHSNGDTWVVFPALRVAFAGDMFPGKMPPAIELTNGGSGVLFPLTLDRAVSEIKDVDLFLTGRSSPMTPADLKEYARFNKDCLSTVQKASRNGKSVDQIAATYTVPDKYKGYSAQPARVKATVRAIVNEQQPKPKK